MLDAFAEGVGSIGQPCSLVVIVPPVGAVLLGRGRWPVVVGAFAGGVVGGWLFAGRRLVLDDVGFRVSAVLVLAAIAVIGLGRRAPWPILTTPVVHAGAAGVVAATALLWWRPCVGDRLGRILTAFPDDPWRQALPMAAFVTGLLVPMAVAAVVVGLLADRPRLLTVAGLTGAACVVVLGMAVLGGAHETVVSRLVEWTL